jgi:ATP-dependent DNA helicase DinG
MRGRNIPQTGRPHRGVTNGFARAVASFLDSHGFSIPLDEWNSSDDAIAARIVDSSIPPAYFLTLAERCDIQALELVREALTRRQTRRDAAGDVAPSSIVHGHAGPPKMPDLDEAFALVSASLGEERAGQIEMARAVAKALKEDSLALLEAGTGTGKSLAYLVPAVLYSVETGERVVVSTYTRNLQDQLCRKEIPVLERALGIDARARRLLGRENYLCTRNVIVETSRMTERSCASSLAFALRITLASDGTIESLGVLPEGMHAYALAAPPRCPMNACALADRCPLIRARKGAREARILFVNHALLLTDYRQGGAVIGPYSKVVFDEAHHLEKCIIENLSVRAAHDDLFSIVEPLLEGKEDDAWKLLMHELECSMVPGNWKRFRKELTRKAKELERAYADLFLGIEQSLNPMKSIRSARTRYVDGGETFYAISAQLKHISFQFNELSELLKPLREMRIPQDLSAFQQEISYAIDELAALSEALKFLAAGQDQESVFWLDWREDGNLKEMCGSPLSVDRSFADYLESVGGSVIFTSATLSQNGSFSFIKERLGLRLLPAVPIETIIPSPFPFDENCLVLIAAGLGDPNEEAFADPVGGIIGELSARIGRRTLVLFTSYRLCFAVAEALGRLGIEGPIFVQGSGEGREVLSGRFRRASSGILLGVASFWEGVDFPGEELEVLVIPKIPFPVPTEPFVEARSQRLSALGEDPFEKLFLPEAIVRMRQGAGRLIRRMDDRGVIIMLDSRLGTKPYGAHVLSALPSKNIVHVPFEECVEHAVTWFMKD